MQLQTAASCGLQLSFLILYDALQTTEAELVERALPKRFLMLSVKSN
jgi:hypothetical protein